MRPPLFIFGPLRLLLLQLGPPHGTCLLLTASVSRNPSRAFRSRRILRCLGVAEAGSEGGKAALSVECVGFLDLFWRWLVRSIDPGGLC